MAEISDKRERLKAKVEEMGIYFEKKGLSPMPGRVLAFLLLAEPPYQDFYSIQESLQASKSAISNALNHLQRDGVVDYITFSGDRRRYFRVNSKSWLDSIESKINDITTLRDLLTDVLHERKDSKYLDFNEGLETIVEFHTFIAGKVEALKAEWNALKAGK
ncbi:MAG: MarR family transcriptional regulator [Lewinellaceae bacterium]|nr:MarR family transcriptional regulator [Lewinellaceae bacterium]